jgi:mono/diheme cytochrome c family protein
MKAIVVLLVAGFLAWAMFACGEDLSAQNSAKTVRTQQEQGKYIVMLGGCNDCHTVGFAESNGQNPAESEWLTGSPVGFRGPWGTSYPANLRLTVNSMTEDAWVQMCKTRQGLPPMPWPSLNHMDESDLRAVYNYIKSLGPKGEKAPVAVAPGQEPQTPYFIFEPQHMERLGNLAK